MKNKIFMIFMLIAILLIISTVNASVCSFLDSNGDCFIGFQEIKDAQDLSLGKQIICAWSNCQSTLDINGDGLVTNTDVNLIRDVTLSKPVTIEGAPSNIYLEFNDDMQLKITVTDSDGTIRSDVNVNYILNEYPSYSGVTTTGANGEAILGVPLELVYERVTAKFWIEADAQKQIPYTEKSLSYMPFLYCAEECSDGIDNDGDSSIDLNDFGCTDATDKNELNNGLAQCSNGVDNDGDGSIDQNDNDCLNYFDNNEGTIVTFQCSDGVDNDVDGLIDYNDLNCYANGFYNPNDNNETTIPDDNTIALYHFDELSGDAVVDSSANNLNGLATGTSIVNGIDGKARMFDGSSDWIDISFNSVMNTPIITVEANVKLNTLAGYKRIADRLYYPGGRAWSFAIAGDTLNVAISPDCSSGDYDWLAPTPTLTVGEWHHVAFTYDGATVKMYQDGIIVFSQPYTGGMCTFGTSPLTIGSYFNHAESFLNGAMDELRISNVVRY